MNNKKLLNQFQELDIDKIRNSGSDLGDIFRFQEKLDSVKKLFNSEQYPNIVEVLSQIYDLIDYTVFKEPNNTESCLLKISKKLKEIQECIKKETDLGSNDIESKTPQNNNQEPKLDEEEISFQNELSAEFFNNINDNIENLEYAVINYEKTNNEEYKTEMLRIIHTIKGEALAVQLDIIADECHKTEDKLSTNQDINTDEIFRLIDNLKNPDLYKHKKHQTQEKDIREPIILSTPKPAKIIYSEDNSDFLGDFLVETNEHLEQIQNNLIQLEKNSDNKDVQNSLFRSFHSIKGIAGFVGLEQINHLTHGVEDLFDLIRNDELRFSGDIVDISFNAYDILFKLVASVEKSLNEGTELVPSSDVSGILKKINMIIGSAAGAKKDFKPTLKPVKSDLEIVSSGPKRAVDIDKYLKADTGSSIKVDITRLDNMVEMIGELVIAEAMVSQNIKSELQDKVSITLTKNMRQLEKITRNIQELSLMLRMIPLRSTFRKMERLVRDLAKSSGKKIDFQISGEEVELDKGMVERLGDPLIHMIRNAVDHGVETTEERKKSGKSEESKIYLKSYHFGGNVIIEISDDGNGLNLKKIKEKAIQNGLIGPDEKISDKELQHLIFNPGFSTAAKITNISGRGVGMDVVKKNIEELRGRIEIESIEGQGTSFYIKLPLTLAIIDGMVIKVGDERYVIPLQNISEIISPDKTNFISVVNQGKMIKLRDELYPLLSVRKFFNLKSEQKSEDESIVIIVEYGENKIGLLIDELVGQQQIVKKSLGDMFSEQQGITGGTIMSDGCVSLIIDIPAIISVVCSKKRKGEK